jgi:RNA polymerase subunit RPABC4/transcription elongation factor Spt4
MKRCGRCGKFTYHNSRFNCEVCPYCGWMETTPDNFKKVVVVKKVKSETMHQFTLCKH